jgi:hypothetical protein
VIGALTTAGLVALAVWLVGSGVLAGFPGKKTVSGATNTSGVVKLTVGNGAAVPFTTAISNLTPDDATATDNLPLAAFDDRIVQITNTSTVTSALKLAVAATEPGAPSLVSDTTNGLRIAAWRCTVSGADPSPAAYAQATSDAVPSCAGTETSLLADSDLPLATTTLVASQAAGKNVNLRLRVRLPQNAPVTYAGQSTSLTLTFSLAQRSGGNV